MIHDILQYVNASLTLHKSYLVFVLWFVRNQASKQCRFDKLIHHLHLTLLN